LSILVTVCAWADDPSDREAIARVIAGVNHHSRPLTDVFTSDAPENERSMLSADEQPWSEVTAPLITIRSIRLITPQVALVECISSQYGSAIMVRAAPLLLVMKKNGTEWQIACVLALPHSAGAAKPSPDH
jgi:hypothetical protein